MNNGPNVVGLIVIGVTAGVSAFSLYLGYKHIKKTRNESNRDEVNVDLNNISFDAEKTLNIHRNNNNNSANNSTEKEDIFKNIGKNIGKLLFKNKLFLFTYTLQQDGKHRQQEQHYLRQFQQYLRF